VSVKVKPDILHRLRDLRVHLPLRRIEMREGKAFITDACTLCGACVEACPEKAIEKDVEPAGPAKDLSAYAGVWVFAEQHKGEVASVSLELLGEGRKLADKRKAKLSAVFLGSGIKAKAKDSSPTVPMSCTSRRPCAQGLQRRLLRGGLTALAQAHKPEIILAGATAIGRSFFPRSPRRSTPASPRTARCSISTRPRATCTRRGRLRRQHHGHHRHAEPPPQMATVRHKVMKPALRDDSRKGEVVEVPFTQAHASHEGAQDRRGADRDRQYLRGRHHRGGRTGLAARRPSCSAKSSPSARRRRRRDARPWTKAGSPTPTRWARPARPSVQALHRRRISARSSTWPACSRPRPSSPSTRTPTRHLQRRHLRHRRRRARGPAGPDQEIPRDPGIRPFTTETGRHREVAQLERQDQRDANWSTAIPSSRDFVVRLLSFNTGFLRASVPPWWIRSSFVGMRTASPFPVYDLALRSFHDSSARMNLTGIPIRPSSRRVAVRSFHLCL